jgi:hypothetical protein
MSLEFSTVSENEIRENNKNAITWRWKTGVVLKKKYELEKIHHRSLEMLMLNFSLHATRALVELFS